jgi:hypothetical protein
MLQAPVHSFKDVNVQYQLKIEHPSKSNYRFPLRLELAFKLKSKAILGKPPLYSYSVKVVSKDQDVVLSKAFPAPTAMDFSELKKTPVSLEVIKHRLIDAKGQVVYDGKKDPSPLWYPQAQNKAVIFKLKISFTEKLGYDSELEFVPAE